MMFLARDMPEAFREALDFTGFAFDEFARRAERDRFRLLVFTLAVIRLRGGRWGHQPSEDRYFERG